MKMVREYKDIDEVLSLIRAFEDATIGREEWKHPEHLAVAVFYLDGNDLPIATEKMRSGIRNLLVNGFGVDLMKEMPYHETITVFWMLTALEFSRSNVGLSLLEKINKVTAEFDKDYPLRFYNRELLFSDRARAEFVMPDLVPLQDLGDSDLSLAAEK